MATYTIQIELLSSTLIGSGSGFGATIDADVMLDECGVPYIPVKRIKGCLKDAAEELLDMFERSGLEQAPFSCEDVSRVFGKPGHRQPTPVYFHDLTVSSEDLAWIRYFIDHFKSVFSRESVTEALTELRRQTAIDPETGVADPHSLRTVRVIREGMTFFGKIEALPEAEPAAVRVLACACKNLKHLGTKRNRGFGHVECKLLDGGTDLSMDLLKRLEELCKG